MGTSAETTPGIGSPEQGVPTGDSVASTVLERADPPDGQVTMHRKYVLADIPAASMYVAVVAPGMLVKKDPVVML